VQTSESPAAGTGPGPRTRPIDEAPAQAARAVELLRSSPATLSQLDAAEARHIVALMRLVSFPTGTVLFREGDRSGTSYLLLLLEGEVTVDLGIGSGAESVTISALGPGSIIGEMSLIDGAPRSAQCTAMSPIVAAGLSRGGLQRLLEEQPRVAAKLLLILAQRLADRVRALGQQMQIYAQLTGAR
jgi:CRP/FNR family cyclic AMP-dependent transcriptional regulator